MRSAGKAIDQQTGQRLSELIELFSDVVFVVEAGSGRILAGNGPAEAAYGYTQAELRRLTVELLRAEPHRSSARAHMAVADSGGIRFETVHRRKNGELFPVEVSSRGTTIGGERVLVSVVRDISERIQAEAKLRESERVFSQVFQCSPECFVISTLAEGRIIDVNEAFLRCTGRARAEVIGESLGELKMWLDPSLPSKLTRAVAESGTVSGIEAVFRRLDGELGYGLVSATRIEVRQVPCLLLVAVDITERKRAEEQLLLVKTSIDRAPHAAYWMDSSGNFVYANESGHVALGYTHEELLSLHVSQVNPRATSERWAEVYQMLKTSGPMTLVSQHRRKDGTILDVELTSAYLRNGDREYCLGFAVDITERLKAEREREQLQAQLLQAQKMESVGRLAGGVAHDFNNMLTVIQMSAQQGFERLTPTDPLYEDLRTISNAAKRSAALTKQLLAFARKQQIAPRVLDLNATIGGMLDMLRRLVGENLELDWHPGVGLWPVRIDPSQLDQLLANLCVNARDAIADVGTVWIETANRTLAAGSCFGATGRVSGDYVELAVRDNGCGMSETVQSHLFEPFYTTKGEGQGTGLGLATVYGIVSQNGGCIDVVSAPLQGTTFKVYLPRQHAKVATVHTEPPPRADVAKHTVLVVEDESAILNLIARQLGRVGYEVLCAQDPAEAIRAAQKHTSEVHLLLTDVVMPQMNGHELARALAALSPGIRCLFMSGYTADVIARHGVLDSEVAFIQKPFTSNELLAQVRSVLGMGSAP